MHDAFLAVGAVTYFNQAQITETDYAVVCFMMHAIPVQAEWGLNAVTELGHWPYHGYLLPLSRLAVYPLLHSIRASSPFTLHGKKSPINQSIDHTLRHYVTHACEQLS